MPQHAHDGGQLESMLSTFAPRYLREAVVRASAPPAAPWQESGFGALLFIDISGFTAMTEGLAEQGPRGAELMSELLDRHYGRLVDHIHHGGGDVIAFAGDAVLAVWWVADREALVEAVANAAGCALLIQQTASVEDTQQVRLSIGAGALSRYVLGGFAGRWHWLVSGPPFAQISRLDAAGAIGEISLSPEAGRLLPDAEFDDASADVLRLRSLHRIASAPAPDTPAVQGHPDAAPGADLDAWLAGFTPEVVAERLAVGQDAFLAEYRRVSVGFVKFDDLSDDASLDALQHNLATVQQVLERYDGHLYQCLRDDKGFIVIVAFGVPPRAHEQDSKRALLAALDIRAALAGQAVSIGMTCGRVFCGAYGGRYRKQYSLIGSTINLAARLMAAAGDHVLCDAACADAAAGQVNFRSVPSIAVKGRAEAVSVFEPLGRADRAAAPEALVMVGRERELELLEREFALLTAQPRTRSPRPVLIEAEAGMGKTTLALAAAERARRLGIRVLTGQADAIESSTPFFPFRPIVQTLVGASDVDALSEWLGGGQLAAMLPLLNSLLPGIGLPADNELTRTLKGSARLEKTNLLILELLSRGSAERPSLIVLEDGHWIDSASWSLLLQLTDALPNVALIMTTRPIDVPPPEYDEFMTRSAPQHLRLESLEATQLLGLVAASLGARTLPETLGELLLERAEGNPFFAQELAFSLRDSGRIVIRDGRVQLASGAVFDGDSVPESVQGVITSRVDLLDAPVQLTAKVASVIGRNFDVATLNGIHPALWAIGGERDRDEEIVDHLDALVAADLIVPEPARGSFLFRHAVTHDTVYALLSYAQRRELHRAAANHLEAHNGHDRDTVLPLLAHHYAEAEMPREAMSALRQAGGHAVATFANREAVRLLRRALEFERLAAEPFGRLDRISIQSELSTAHYCLTDYERTLQHAWHALDEVGSYHPNRGRTLPRAFATYAVQRIRERLTGRRGASCEGTARDEQLSAMQALAVAMPALGLLGRDAEYVEAALLLHKLGASLEPSSESGASRAALGLCFAMMGWKSTAEQQLRRGLDECLATGDGDNIVQAQMLLGMYLQMRGRLREAEEVMQAGMDALEQSPAPGIWHHRGKLQLGSVQDALGRTDAADRTLAEGLVLARKAEPQVCGLYAVLRGISLLHAGRDEEAASLIEYGEAHARDHQSRLLVFAALGGVAELALRRGDRREALKAATESFVLSRREGEVNSFVYGLYGYAGAMMVFCDGLLLPESVGEAPGRAEMARSARAMSRAFARFARRFDVAKPRQLALEGLRQHATGRTKSALKLWNTALTVADATGQPYDRRLVAYYAEAARRGEPIHATGV